MPAPISPAGPSFIHLDTWDSTPPKQSPSSRPSRQLPIHRGTASTITTNSALSSDRRSVNTTVDNTYDSIESTTMFLKRFTLTSSSGHHHQPHWSSNKRRGRPGTSRIRGKHGFVKILHANSNSLNTLRCHPFSKEARSAQFKKLMQNRRLRLRQRSGGNQQQLDIDQQDGRFQDSSDMSTDESEAQDKENDEKAIDHMSFDLNPEQYRHYMWELEQRLLERTASATKSRSSFLMRRRLSASERLHHVQKVVQQQRTEQELKQHKVRVELEQKMVQAMARRNAHLEAAIENDPSRRFRHKTASKSSISVSTTTSNKVTSPKLGSTVSTAIIPVASTKTNLLAPCAVTPKKSTLSKVASPSMTRSKLMKRDPYRSVKENADSNNYNSNNISSINKNNNTQIEKDDERLHGRESPKNSTFNMTHNRKAHLTSMTSVSSLSSSSPSSSSPLSSLSVLPSTAKITEMGPIKGFQHISKEVGEGVGVDATQLERMTLWTQRRIRLRLVEKASREYMQAIGGSHQRVLELGFDELARLLHTNKALIQSTIKLLMYSSQLVQMDTPIEARSKQVKKNLARVFLSMYMILAHPYQIQSPPEHTHSSQVEVDSSFDSLVESSKALLEALQTWIAANTKHNENVTSVPLSTPNTPSITQGTNAAALYNFDAAWTSYYNFFEAWKDKDSQRLLKALLDHAQQIETLWSTVQNDPTARAEWGLQIEKQRKDLREKARQIAGPDGVAKIDEIFADFVRVTTSASLPSSTTTLLNTATSPASETIATVSMEADSGTGTSIAQPTVIDSTHPSYSLEEPISPSTSTSATITSNTTKKRQRVLSIPNDDSPMNMDEPSIGTHLVPPVVVSATSTSNEDDLTSTMEGPQPKKPTRARGPRQPAMPAGFEKQEKWSNLQLIHELALDPNFKIESKRSGGAGPTSDEEDGGGNDANNAESLESRIRAMATKAYFDKIREDAEQGQLAKWIPPLLTTIREQLLDMVPSQSSVARQIREGFDLDFVQQQVDRKVYDVKAALESVLSLMAKLCAPVRDPAIRKIQHDLSLIHGNPLQQLPSQTNSQTVRSTSTSATPKDFVSVLKDILELLEEMLMDLANYRLMVARPSLEKQAIPYEQHAFKTSLESGDITLDATTAWLEVSAAKVLNTPTISTPTTTTESIPTTSVTTSSSSPLLPPPSLSSSVKTNRHYEVYVNAVLDLLYSKTPLELASKEEFPETFMLDQARLTRYQNELQALTLIAVMLNISLNVQPPLRGEEQDELKQTLFRLMEKVDTSKESLAEAIIEAKEKALLLTARPSSSLSARATSSATSSAASFLLSAEQKSYLRNTIERAISFDSSLYNMLSQRIRKVLESYLLSSQPGGKLGVMPNPPELIKFGLGAMTKEIENFSAQIGFLIRYNAKVYQSWYDPILTKILPGTTRTSSKSKTSGSGSGTASIPASASSSAATDPIPTVASGTETKTSSNTPDTVVDPTASTSSLAQENSTANGKSGSSPSPPSPSPSV